MGTIASAESSATTLKCAAGGMASSRGPILALIVFAGFGAGYWSLHAERFVSDDSYFYLVIARNMVLSGRQTFNGLFDTNGVHPLWLWLLAGYSYLVQWFDAGLLHRAAFAVPLSAALAGWATINCWSIARRAGLSPLLFTGILLSFSVAMGVLYSEAHLHAATLTWLIALLVRRPAASARRTTTLAIAMAAAFLARLDAVFSIAALAAWSMWHWRNQRQMILAAIGAAALVAPYLIHNQIVFGGMMPVSGWMKSTWPSVYLKGLTAAGFSLSFCGYSILFGWVPLVLAIATLRACRSRMTAADSIWRAMTAGVLAHFLYICLFTRSHTEGHWYYIQSMVLGSAAACLLLRGVGARERMANGAGVAVLLVAAAMIAIKRRGPWPPPAHPVAQALKYMHDHRIENQTLILSDYPGYIAFKTNNHVFAMDMLTSNRRFYQHMRQSPDAMKFVLAHCAALGKPATHLFHVPSRLYLARPADDLSAVFFHDPRDQARSIGRLDASDGLGKPFVDGPLVVWPLGAIPVGDVKSGASAAGRSRFSRHLVDSYR